MRSSSNHRTHSSDSWSQYSDPDQKELKETETCTSTDDPLPRKLATLRYIFTHDMRVRNDLLFPLNP
jgi:hypothetical protein